MAMTPHLLSTNLNDALYSFLQSVEGNIPFVYSDSKGIPTIGMGYALAIFDNSTKQWGLRGGGTKTGLSTEIGVQLSDQDWGYLTQAVDALNKVSGVSNPIPTSSGSNIFSFTITDTQSRALFDTVIGTYITQVQTWLGDAKWAGDTATIYDRLQGSQEMVALVSLAYNGVLAQSNNLLNDLKNGDRLAAWYEISYHSNGGSSKSQGIANRRYQEAALFGMWDSATPTTTELANFETFLLSTDPYNSGTFRLQYMRDYEADYPPSGDIYTIDDYINDTPAVKNYFVNKYAPQGATIDGRVLICAELDSDVISTTADLTKSQIKSGYLKSTDKNDLIIGGAGADKIDGGAGNDTLYGGAGFDTYIFNTGDGQDTIADSDQIGTIIYDGKAVLSGLHKNSDPADTWYGQNGEIFTKSGNDLVITKTGPALDSITIKDYFTIAAPRSLPQTSRPSA